MLSFEQPYFLSNELWYMRDPEKHIYYLTELAPEEAKESYEKYLKEHKEYLKTHNM